ncbi:MAG: porin family protein [Chitinophagales bacterium]
MKQLITVFVALMIGFGAYAQKNIEEKSDSTETTKELSKAKETVNNAKDRLVFEFNTGVLLNDGDNGFSPKGFQRGMNIYFMYDVVIKNSPVSIAPGIGVGSDNWYHNSQVIFTDTFTSFVPFTDSFSYKKSKLGLTYIDVPIELRFRGKPNSKNNWQWKLAAGFKIGFLIHSKWKYKGEDFRVNPQAAQPQDGQVKLKEFGVPNLEKLRYGVTARGGYGPFNLHMYYSLSSLFQDGKGIELQPITFGISINGL